MRRLYSVQHGLDTTMNTNKRRTFNFKNDCYLFQTVVCILYFAAVSISQEHTKDDLRKQVSQGLGLLRPGYVEKHSVFGYTVDNGNHESVRVKRA